MMAHRNEIQIGANPSLNNLIMFRKVNNLPFIPHYYFDENDEISVDQSKIVVNYIQYYKNSSNQIIDKLTEVRSYEVRGQRATNWFLQLAKTPINNMNGIMDEIEGTLSLLPLNIPDGFII